MELLTKMYCPRCGYEGDPTMRLFTFAPFCFPILRALMIIGLLALSLTWGLYNFLILASVFCVVMKLISPFYFDWIFGTCCPRCRYVWAISLDDHQAKQQSPKYRPPHLNNQKNVYKNGKIIPWS